MTIFRLRMDSPMLDERIYGETRVKILRLG